MRLLQKIVVLCLSVSLILSCSFVTFATEETVVIESEISGGTSISATTVIIPTPNYTVTVPTGISVGDIIKSEETDIKSSQFVVGVSNFSNLDGKQIKVTLSTPYNAFQMRNGNHVLPYEVFNTPNKGDGRAISINGTFYTFTAAGSVTGHIEVDQFNIPAEGEYGGILTFTFQVEDIPAQ